MKMYNSSLKLGVSQTYLDFVPSYEKCINYLTSWVNRCCQLDVEQVIFESGMVADDQLTITDKGVTMDMMMDMYTVNSKWFSIVGMFFPMDTSSFFIFSKNPLKIEKDSIQNLFPINVNVYICMLSIMVLASCVLTLTKYRFKRFWDLPESHANEFANMAVVLVRQGDIKRRKTLPYRVLFGTWLLGAFLISATTQTYLNCEFANSQFVVMDVVSDVVNNLQKVYPIVFRDSNIGEYLKNSMEEEGPTLWKHLNETDKFVYMTDLVNVINMLSEKTHYAFFTTKSQINIIGTGLLGVDDPDRVFQGRPLEIVSMAAVHGPNITPACKEQLNRKFVKVQEMKLVDAEVKEVGFFLDKQLFRPTLDQQEFELNWSEFKSTLVILFIGYSIAVACAPIIWIVYLYNS